MSVDSLRAQIREVPDFPKPGILFYDITTLIKQAKPFAEVIDLLVEPFANQKVDVVVGMESRGFIFSAPMAIRLDAGFVPVRKLGKLPAETISVEYALEYGTNTLEVHKDAIQPGQKVLIVDDLLATGGTVLGTIDLVKQLKAEIVGLSFLVELQFLKGRARLRWLRHPQRHPVLRARSPNAEVPRALPRPVTLPPTRRPRHETPPRRRRRLRRLTTMPVGASSSGSSAGRPSRP